MTSCISGSRQLRRHQFGCISRSGPVNYGPALAPGTPPLQVLRGLCAVFASVTMSRAVGGRMFIFGGWFESSSSSRMYFLQDFYVLDPSSVIWSVPRVRCPPLAIAPHDVPVAQASGCPPSARAYAAAVGLKDSFIVVGGTEGHLPWQVGKA
jgi:hypothetical protein